MAELVPGEAVVDPAGTLLHAAGGAAPGAGGAEGRRVPTPSPPLSPGWRSPTRGWRARAARRWTPAPRGRASSRRCSASSANVVLSCRDPTPRHVFVSLSPGLGARFPARCIAEIRARTSQCPLITVGASGRRPVGVEPRDSAQHTRSSWEGLRAAQQRPHALSRPEARGLRQPPGSPACSAASAWPRHPHTCSLARP